jgi:hypothetical protein
MRGDGVDVAIRYLEWLSKGPFDLCAPPQPPVERLLTAEERMLVQIEDLIRQVLNEKKPRPASQ